METVENCLIFQQKKLLHNTIAHKVKASAHSFELSENLRILAADAFFFSGLALSVKSFGFASSPKGRGVTAGDGEGEAVDRVQQPAAHQMSKISQSSSTFLQAARTFTMVSWGSAPSENYTFMFLVIKLTVAFASPATVLAASSIF